MILNAVDSKRQIVCDGVAPLHDERDLFKPSVYMEFMGGLGDVILRMHQTGGYVQLDQMKPGESAVVVIMSHNPYVRELFEWHPSCEVTWVYDLGFTTPFHPWENMSWRIRHGLPQSQPMLLPPPKAPVNYYPSPDDLKLIEPLSKSPYVVISVSAGEENRTIPGPVRESIADWVIGSGFRLVVVGRSKYRRDRNLDIRQRPNVVDTTDLLSVPGVAELIRRSAAVVSSHTSVFHIAIEMNKPTMLLYPDFVRERYVTKGPVGYMKGIDRAGNDHMEFKDYTQKRMAKWIEGFTAKPKA